MPPVRSTLIASALALTLGLGLAVTISPTATVAAPAATNAIETAQPFTQAAFDAAQKAGGPILVEVTASWCPTCKAQKPILSELLAKPEYAKTTVLNVDFDSQKDALAKLGVRMQSTLISYKGANEVGRSTGATDARVIEGQLAKSI